MNELGGVWCAYYGIVPVRKRSTTRDHHMAWLVPDSLELPGTTGEFEVADMTVFAI